MVVGRMSYYSRVSSLEREERKTKRKREKLFIMNIFNHKKWWRRKERSLRTFKHHLDTQRRREKKKLTRSGWNPLIN